MTANTPTSVTPARVSGRFAAGASGNPTGRAAGEVVAARRLSARIGELTRDGDAILERLVELGVGAPATSAADRRLAVMACEVLLERYIGRPLQEVALQVQQPAGPSPVAARMRQLTVAQLEALAALDELPPDEPPPAA